MFACMVAAPFLPKADVVVTTSPQFFNGLAGYPVSRMKRAPWILEIRDLWPESVVAVGGMKRGPIIRLLEALEMFAYRNADAIVPVTDSFERYMIGKGIAAAKIHVIKNGVDASVYRPHAGTNPLRTELGLDGKFVAAYFGTHGMAHKLETLLEAAGLLRDHPDIVFLLIGDGAERQRLLGLRDAQGLSNVKMLDQQPKSKMPLLWDLAAVSVVHLKKSPVFKTVIPSKIFESMAMEKPVLIGVEGESAEIIGKAGAGICVEPENAAQLASAVLRLAGDPDTLRSMGERGRAFVIDNFDRDRLAMRYEALIGRVVSGLEKILLVAGARPNFVKIAPLMRALRARSGSFDAKLVHTGQHYDMSMSESFFEELGIPQPDFRLEVGSHSHAQQTARIMMAFEGVCLEEACAAAIGGCRRKSTASSPIRSATGFSSPNSPARTICCAKGTIPSVFVSWAM